MPIPSNAVDAASALKDGELGFIEEIKIGDLLVSALTGLYGSDEMDVTDKPIQADYTVTDAAVLLSTERTLDIVLTNPNLSVEAGVSAALSGDPASLTETWRDKKEELFSMFKNKELITVQTHEAVYENMIIRRITPWYDVDENWDAYFATVEIKEIRKVGDDVGGAFDQAKQSVGL